MFSYECGVAIVDNSTCVLAPVIAGCEVMQACLYQAEVLNNLVGDDVLSFVTCYLTRLVENPDHNLLTFHLF